MDNFENFKDRISKDIDNLRNSEPNNENNEELDEFFKLFLNKTYTSQNKTKAQQEMNYLEQMAEKRTTIFKIVILFFLISSLITLVIWLYLYEKNVFKILILLLFIIIFSRIEIDLKIKRREFWYTKKSEKRFFRYAKNLFENSKKK